MVEEKAFDILVIGGGHGGIEAAGISARFGLKVALLTMRGVSLGSTPCNPSIGGVGKGQVVREIDYLGGLMGNLLMGGRFTTRPSMNRGAMLYDPLGSRLTRINMRGQPLKNLVKLIT